MKHEIVLNWLSVHVIKLEFRMTVNTPVSKSKFNIFVKLECIVYTAG